MVAQIYRSIALTVLLTSVSFGAKGPKKPKEPVKTALEQYVDDAHQTAIEASAENPGSLLAGPVVLADLSTDLRARNVNDIVTIIVSEQASAVSTGLTKTQRSSNASAAVTSASGSLAVPNRFSNLITLNGNNQLNGQGTTSRTTTLTTTISARVVDVLPNGFLVIEGSKTVLVNSENQIVTVRGVVRPYDLSRANTVLSGSVAEMELKINGRGVVNDAVRRPNILYRILLGALPF
ncbi:MAG: flagellar basal body L-ring protein FlgH [Bryobacteraceae bacterium]